MTIDAFAQVDAPAGQLNNLGRWANWRLNRLRKRKHLVAPHLVFRNPNDIDRYTVTDLRAVGAFYLRAALQEPDGKVFMPASVPDLDDSLEPGED